MKKIVTSIITCITIGLANLTYANQTLKQEAERHGWRIHEEKDEMTDEKQYAAYKLSETSIPVRKFGLAALFYEDQTNPELILFYDTERKYKSLIISLRSDSLRIPFKSESEYLLRIDKNKALRRVGEIVGAGEAVNFELGWILLDELKMGSKFKARIPIQQRGEETSYIIEFDLSGAKAAIDYIYRE